MKLVSESMMLTFSEDVTVGDLSVTLEAMVIGTKDCYDIEFQDVDNIKFCGIPINGYDNWKKFKKFHLEMGIDFSAILQQRFDDVFTKSAIDAQLKNK